MARRLPKLLPLVRERLVLWLELVTVQHDERPATHVSAGHGHTTAVSILDRLLHHATVVVTSGDSYCMRESRQPRGGHQNLT